MEELIESFATSEVTKQENSTAREHPLFSLYKVRSRTGSQDERRKRFLEAQKQKRYDYTSHARRLATNEWNDEKEKDDKSEDMDYEETYVKPPKSYKNQLMLSEWLVEIPSDLAKEWLLVLCPVGKRSLVVASRGITKIYTRSGYLINSFHSHLPGGSCRNSGVPLNAYSLLDCVYSEEHKTYYILDIMCWNSCPCFDSETEFRFYWLHAKIEEYPQVKCISKEHPYKFIPLPYFDCDTESIRKAIWSPLTFEPQLDGLLFYHKKTHYQCGTTPLVGWLKAYMLPEILQIPVPDEMCADKPASYVSMEQHIPEAFKKNQLRKQMDQLQMQYEDD